MTKTLLHVCAIWTLGLCVLPCAARGQDRYAGKYEGDKLSVEFVLRDGAYAGEIRLGQQGFPLKAREQAGRLDGTFTRGADTFDFTATPVGDGLTLRTGQSTYNLKRLAPSGNPLSRPQPANPLAQSPAAPSARPSADALAGYTTVTTTDAGKALSVQKPGAASVQTALESTFHDLGRYFDARPSTSGAFEDSQDHKSGGASFTAKLNGQAVKGFVSCKLGDKGAIVAVIYCRTDAAPAEWNKLVSAAPDAGRRRRPSSPPTVQLPRWHRQRRSGRWLEDQCPDLSPGRHHPGPGRSDRLHRLVFLDRHARFADDPDPVAARGKRPATGLPTPSAAADAGGPLHRPRRGAHDPDAADQPDEPAQRRARRPA